MARRRQAEIQLFSTSFLDLLSCSLAAVALLWVTGGKAQLPPSPPSFSVISIRQRENNHFGRIAVMDAAMNELAVMERLWTKAAEGTNERGGPTLSGSRGTSPLPPYDPVKSFMPLSEKASAHFVDSLGVPQAFLEWNDSKTAYPGALTLIVGSKCPPGALEIVFRECRATTADHSIEILTETSHASPQTRKLELKADAGAMAPPKEGILTIRFSGGNVSVETSGFD